ncbi:hypothetical protein H9649_12045 [Sporosarcina sp. Sa2YVA2]|uniref:Uncharacterized protein n=1 Tax=Sporosarcina quadrami TaxID=2762234 RepID=A0ABR8UBD0_9BACL|nr:hypothetical protein [Sporosarcina quadrami]MBD7985321.1 hypothetical protein [Sporosarcina quadrami]
MKFIENYSKAIEKINQRISVLEGQNETDQQKLDQLQKEYKGYLHEGDIDQATSLRKQIKELETEMETRSDMIEVLQDPKGSLKQDAAIKAAKEYLKVREDYGKRREKTIRRVQKLQAEYLAALHEAVDFNNELHDLTTQIGRLKNATNWKSEEVKAQTGVDMNTYINGSRLEISMLDYFVQHGEIYSR